jgi:hypothetical protein
MEDAPRTRGHGSIYNRGCMVRTEIGLQESLEANLISPNCRKRLWRSEIEVTLEDKDASLESLEQRRRTREPCTCLSVTQVKTSTPPVIVHFPYR